MSLMDYMEVWEKFKFQLHDCFSGSCCRMQTCIIVEQKNRPGFSVDLDISVFDAEVVVVLVVVPC